LYTLCAGRPTFAAGNTMAVLKRVCEETPRLLREVNPDIPEWLAAVVDRLLAKAPADRFQTAAELAEVLGQHLSELQQSRRTPALAPATSGGPAARKGKRWALVAGVLGLVAVAACLVAMTIPSRPGSVPAPLNPSPPDDPRVLTVSQKPETGGRFRTIQEALDNVEPGMTIRVLDDAFYDEYLLIGRREQQRGVVLEAAGKATIRRLPGKTEMVWIRGVPDFTLRGFCMESDPPGHHCQVHITGHCPGVLLDRLNMRCAWDCVNIYDVPLSGKDAPIVIQNCTMRAAIRIVLIEGADRENHTRPIPSGHVVVRSNILVRSDQEGVVLTGAVHHVHVVGNLILDTGHGAIALWDLLPEAADILIANNTLLRNREALGIWDDHPKRKDFLKCKNMRFQNNLVLQPQREGDLFLFNYRREDGGFAHARGDPRALHNSGWHFSHNWREIDAKKAAARSPDRWIPCCPNDHLQVPIKVLSRRSDDADFLRPPKSSPLATSGAGVTDPALPAYVGALPPEGAEHWDWDKAWKAMTR
jgi:hypothetical protein